MRGASLGVDLLWVGWLVGGLGVPPIFLHASRKCAQVGIPPPYSLGGENKNRRSQSDTFPGPVYAQVRGLGLRPLTPYPNLCMHPLKGKDRLKIGGTVLQYRRQVITTVRHYGVLIVYLYYGYSLRVGTRAVTYGMG